MKRRANWIGWTMHGFLGLLVGAGIGLFIIHRRGGVFWIDNDLIAPFLIGAACIGAGLGSRYGDRLWIGDNYHMLPPDEPEQSHLSDWLSWCLVGAGIATCVVTVLKQFNLR
jgi:hypothetical protein